MNELIYQNLQRWAKDIIRFVPIKSSFILHGNIHDIFPFPYLDGETVSYIPYPLETYLAEALKADGYKHFIGYDPVDGFILKDGNSLEYFKKVTQLKFEKKQDGIHAARVSLLKAMDALRSLVNLKDRFLAIFIDFASRLPLNLESLTEEEHEFFTRALKLTYEAQPHLSEEDSFARMNPVFWFCEKVNDLPSWFSVDNPKVRIVNIPKPDAQIRRQIISAISPDFYGYKTIHDHLFRNELMDAFVDLTDNMLVHDLLAICQLSVREGVSFEKIHEAVKHYKLGVTENPWSKLLSDSPEKIKNAENRLAKRVKGQKHAIVKVVDIIKRAVTGLAGIQHAKTSNKPKGVLFFAGPTGVGKTELAKSLTELIFGDENAYIRFDMSEFSQPHADQRLLGAPPGYVGYRAGGELTNAVREKPFSVILFDEIEKAHPRILDKFLQILEDGRITDGRGETVYFSESIIIFTSNLGVHSVGALGNKLENVQIEMNYEDMKTKLMAAIEHYFKVELGRPEILNRIGENIVIFDYIRPNVAEQILDKIWQNLVKSLKETNKIHLKVKTEAYDRLKNLCIQDLTNGGRGIGNRFEAYCINPLARALFDAGNKKNNTITLTEIDVCGGVPYVSME